MNFGSLSAITIEGHPYLYGKATERVVLYSLDYTQPTIVEAGEYIVLDRYFNTCSMTAREMNRAIEYSYKKFKPAREGEGGVGAKNKKQVSNKG